MHWHFRKPTLIETLVLIAFVAVLVALILPPAKWAASGSIRIPVRVLVFDASEGKPIANAHVAVFWAPSLLNFKQLEAERDLYDSKRRVREGNGGTKYTDGTAIIEYEFRTGANYERPTMYADLRSAWVRVHAEGYGGVVVPVRHESLPTKTLREQKELLVPVGLTRDN
jgi:hypothetical protein